MSWKSEKSKHWAASVVLALFFSYFLYKNIEVMLVWFKPSIFLLVVFYTCLVMFLLIRHVPKASSTSALDYFLTISGSLVALLLVGNPQASDSLPLLALQLTGLAVSLAGLLSLNRSFGLVPADRGIITSGMYRYIRHPLYSGYFLQNLAFLIQNFSVNNVAVFTAFVIFETCRLFREEKFLRQNPEYKAYMEKVRWRIIPYLL